MSDSLAQYYPHVKRATRMATTDYDLALGGSSVTLMQIDDHCEELAGAGAATQLLADHPDVIGVGPDLSVHPQRWRPCQSTWRRIW
jgi:hypothetical protein